VPQIWELAQEQAQAQAPQQGQQGPQNNEKPRTQRD